MLQVQSSHAKKKIGNFEKYIQTNLLTELLTGRVFLSAYTVHMDPKGRYLNDVRIIFRILDPLPPLSRIHATYQ